MGRNERKTKHKVRKFRASYDETLGWQEKIEIQQLGRKKSSKRHKREKVFKKWLQNTEE